MSMDSDPNQQGQTPGTGHASDDERWLDRPGSVDTLIKVLVAVSVASVLADFFYHKHGHWHFQEWIGFDAAYGFVACVGLVLAAKGLRVLLMRGESYYGDQDEATPQDGESHG